MAEQFLLPDLTDLDKKSFLEGRYEAVELCGPLKLYRLAGWGEYSRHFRGAVGKYWMAASTFDELKRRVAQARSPSPEFEKAWDDLRHTLAVPKAWNDFSLAFKLDVPAGAVLRAWSGIIGGQQEALAEEERFLPGGAVQYLLNPVPLFRNGWIDAERGIELPGGGVCFARVHGVEILGRLVSKRSR